MNNAEYRDTKEFIKSCQKYAEIVCHGGDGQDKVASEIRTTRQASKYRRGTGIVWKTLNSGAA